MNHIFKFRNTDRSICEKYKSNENQIEPVLDLEV